MLPVNEDWLEAKQRSNGIEKINLFSYSDIHVEKNMSKWKFDSPL